MGSWDGVIGGLADELARAFARAGRIAHFAADELLIREGDAGDALYVILAGRVRVFIDDGAGREQVLGRYGPGEIVGEMALDGKPRSASVRATEAVTCSVLGFAALPTLLAARPGVTKSFIVRLIGRVRSATLHVRDLALLDVYGRIARLLLELEAEARDAPAAPRERLTQQEIASRVGASREMVGKILKDLIAGGYIARDGKRITVLRRPPARW